MAKFSGYGFNKSHSAAYALVAYQTAYLKTHYPVEFMAALLTSETSKPENVVKYIGECREMNISVEPPDVQLSGAQFTPHGAAIRFGLAAVKNVGGNAIESIIKARAEVGGRFKSFWEFCEKVDLRVMNKRVIESLIKAGALDSLGTRGQFSPQSTRRWSAHRRRRRMLRKGRPGFSACSMKSPRTAKTATICRRCRTGKRASASPNEKEVLGFFVSGHPLDKYADKIKNLSGVISTAEALRAQAARAALGPAGRSRR